MCSLLTVPPPSSPSLLVFKAEGGRLGARMTMYSMLMVLRWEYNVLVMIDRKTMEYLGQAFDIEVKIIISTNNSLLILPVGPSPSD